MPDGSADSAAENKGGIGMLKRTISGVILVLIMIGLMYVGGILLLVGLLAMSLIGLWEFFHAVSAGGHKPYLYLGMAGTLFYYGLIWSAIENVWSSAIFLLYIVVFLMALMIRSVTAYPKRRVEDGALTLMGFLYVPVLFSFLYFLREQEDGIFYVWYVFMASWGCDTCAYLAGRFFGKHKMSPHLSPKKTVEGAIGGTLGAILLSMIYAFCIHAFVHVDSEELYILSFFIGLFGALLGQLGDLFASSIKRVMGIKDFGHLIPGHGGILDRFDSTLLVGPAIMIVIFVMTYLS